MKNKPKSKRSKYISPFIFNIVQVLIPVFLFLSQNQNFSKFQFYSFALSFYVLLIFTISINAFGFVDIVGNLNRKNKPFLIIVEFLKFVFLISLFFSAYFFTLQLYDPDSFIGVIDGNTIEKVLDFYFYSMTNFILNNSSDIKPNSLVAKGLVATQTITSFSTIVLYLAYYKSSGSILNQLEEKIFGK